MNKFLHNYWHLIINWFQKQFCKNRNNELSAINFYSLAPTDEVKNGGNYFNALSWALVNRETKNIKNIALTGSYGSGKSSILQSFQKKNSNKKLHFLNISLATFKEEKEIKDKTEGENLQRLIELSILQQLFYREKDQKLPDSRLKKITSFSLIKLLFFAFGCLVLILSFILLIKPTLLSSVFLNIEISKETKIVVHYISLIISIIGAFFIVLKSVRIFHNLKIRKLNINNAEIEISDNINKSVLNHNLEEILYFFEATPYNVVIIEDLDRFQETEIFTKLREINLLINNSKKIDKSVVFIYAIRDEMFSDKDRTKFFDFIIPVIPIINSSNSHEILQKEIKSIAENISDSLIDDISLFIDEMRVLYNIVNEFQIYKQLLSSKLNIDKLLSIVVYKNICPCDFVKLSNYEGDLYNIISKKQEYIKQQSDEIDKEITDHKNEIKRINELKIRDIKELRAAYVLQYVKLLNNIIAFRISSQDYSPADVIADDIFPYLLEDKVHYNYYTPHRNYSQMWNLQAGKTISHKFVDIEKAVNPQYTYEERAQLIEDWNNDKTQELRTKIDKLEKQKNELRTQKVGYLLSSRKLSVETKDNKQKLINLLLKNGYIDEDFLDYISLFHEGSLSKNDHTFLLNVKSQIDTDFNHNLDKVENLIKKIHIDDFKRDYILNYKLVDFILANGKYDKQKDAIFSILKNEIDKSIKFIDGYIDNGGNPQLFIKELYHYRISVFDFMYRASGVIDKKLAQYLKLIIENADISDIKETSIDSFLPVAISDNPNGNYNFFDLISDEARIIDVLKDFDIKFKYDFASQNISESIFDYIYENNHYRITVDLLRIVMQKKGEFNQVDFDTRNYYAINNSNCSNLVKHIEINIKNYVANVYLKLGNNTKEDETWLIKLLNNESLTHKEKTAIIQKTETKVSDLEKIDDIEIDNILLQNSKVASIWKNIIYNFNNTKEDAISEYIVAFLNNSRNAEMLSKSQIPKEPDESIAKKIARAIILNEEINNESYALLLKSVPHYYNNLNFTSLSAEKVKLLIENNKLRLTQENYNRLREDFINLHTTLIEKRKHELSDVIDSLEFDDDDIMKLLKSSILSTKEKLAILVVYDNATIIANAVILGLIGGLVNNTNSNDWDKEILKAIFTNSKIPVEEKLILFNNINHRFEKEGVTEILQSFPEPYSSIAENGKRPLLPDSDTNTNLVGALKNRKYIKDFKPEKNGLRISTFRKD